MLFKDGKEIDVAVWLTNAQENYIKQVLYSNFVDGYKCYFIFENLKGFIENKVCVWYCNVLKICV